MPGSRVKTKDCAQLMIQRLKPNNAFIQFNIRLEVTLSFNGQSKLWTEPRKGITRFFRPVKRCLGQARGKLVCYFRPVLRLPGSLHGRYDIYFSICYFMLPTSTCGFNKSTEDRRPVPLLPRVDLFQLMVQVSALARRRAHSEH